MSDETSGAAAPNDSEDEEAQSLITVTDVVCAVLVAGVIWFAVGAIAMLIGLFWMCG